MRFPFTLILIALTASAPVSKPAMTLSSDSEGHWVPFALTPGNQIRFAMTINGTTANALLDTGVSHSMVSTGFAHAAQLKPASTGKAVVIGGTVDLAWSTARSMRLGGLQMDGAQLGVIALPRSAGGGASIDALIGGDILSCCALDIDYDAGRFRLLPSGRMPFAGVRAPLTLAKGSPVYVSELSLGAKAIRPMLVDTGDGSMVTVTRDAWDAAHSPNSGVTSTVAYGLGGEVGSDLAVVRNVRLAALNADDVEVRIEDRGNFSAQTGLMGRIGTGFLQRYRVLLDPRAGQMIFAASTRATAPTLRSTSGLLVAREPGKFRVLHVMRGSPAARSGWANDELICSIEGKVVRDGGDGANTGWFAADPGRTIRIGMCDGTARQLTLKRFY